MGSAAPSEMWMCLILTTGRREGDADSGDLGYYLTFSAYMYLPYLALCIVAESQESPLDP